MKARVIIDDKYLTNECGIGINSIVDIISTKYSANKSYVISYQVRLSGYMQHNLTMRPHELEIINP